jgi:hypothetical protein
VTRFEDIDGEVQFSYLRPAENPGTPPIPGTFTGVRTSSGEVSGTWREALGQGAASLLLT